MPANVSENIRPIVTAGFANDGGTGEPVRRADIGADRRRGQHAAPGTGEREDQQHQSRRGDHLADQVPAGDPMLGGQVRRRRRTSRWPAPPRRSRRGTVPPCRRQHVCDESPVPARRPSNQSTIDTTGLKCAPDTGPSIRISTASPNAVAVLFSSSCRPTSFGDSCWAAIPEPTTTVTSSPVPRNSANSRRPSTDLGGTGGGGAVRVTPTS